MLQTKLKQKVAANLVAKEKKKAAQMIRSGSLKNEKYDYQELAEVSSSVSTPSNSFWENPFASDSLGETAINLDKVICMLHSTFHHPTFFENVPRHLKDLHASPPTNFQKMFFKLPFLCIYIITDLNIMKFTW